MTVSEGSGSRKRPKIGLFCLRMASTDVICLRVESGPKSLMTGVKRLKCGALRVQAVALACDRIDVLVRLLLVAEVMNHHTTRVASKNTANNE